MKALVGSALAWIDRRFPLTEFLRKQLTDYLAPRNLSYLWNSGSVAGMFLVVQTLTGLWLALYYKPQEQLAFESVQHIVRDVNFGWLLRSLHAGGASCLFLAMYVHVGRALYYGSYKAPRELLWWIGFAIYLALMGEAFIGYLLPWGQMSYWSATVITNLFGVVPVVGPKLVVWLRGDFAIGDATLGRFYAFHIALFPVAVIGALVSLHLTALRRVGSNHPHGTDLEKPGPHVIPFHPYYVLKDLWFGALVLAAFLAAVFYAPSWFTEPANSEPANPLQTPLHIVPEWYFLAFYAILRAVPHKLGGALAMAASLLVHAFLPYLDRSPVRSARYRPVKRVLTLLFFVDFAVLTYVGSLPPVGTALLVGRAATVAYFLYFLALPFLPRFEKTKPLPDGIKP
ncbi:MAG: cytochrome b N-terminal domain-containing protein [Deltaproteobacteria bacterium]|nr:cytochrome b N-terminal domain-containing protein [Deltaproteobacteria bacterium]